MDLPWSTPVYMQRDRFRGICTGYDGTAVPASRERVLAQDQSSAGQECADELRIPDRGTSAGRKRGFFAGNRDRLGCIHRRAHAYRGGTLSTRIRHDGFVDHRSDRWNSRSKPNWEMAEGYCALNAPPPPEDVANVTAVGLGTRGGDSAVHAGARWPHRNAVAATVVLAIPEIPRQPRREGTHLYPQSE